MEWRELPLFPLNTVLVPGAPLALHVFEERYKLMVNSCVEAGKPFGIALIREGEEVGEPAQPHDVGTVAHILALTRLDDGRMNLAVGGGERFRITEIVCEKPYVVGRLRPLEDARPEPQSLVAAATLVREQLPLYIRRLLELAGMPERELELPGEAESLSWAAAMALQLRNEDRQKLLEMTDTVRRLEVEARLLAHGIRALTALKPGDMPEDAPATRWDPAKAGISLN
jgi:uncharacterized protein